MKKDTIHNIQMSMLIPSPVNQRRFTKKNGSLKELAGSIDSQGLLQPIVIRGLSGSELYEIVAGERRFRAFQLLKRESIPAIIKVMTDQEAREATATENLQREDLTPLEEAESIRVLLSEGVEIKDIADRLGKSTRWVARRSNLTKLAPCWIKATTDLSSGISKWGAVHLELIARYPESRQRELLEDIDHHYDSAIMTVEEIKQWLSGGMLLLSSAPWKVTDETLVPSRGACTACNCRSSCSPNLFDAVSSKKGVKKDFCLSKECWGLKLIAHHTTQISKLKEENKDLVLVHVSGTQSDILPTNNPWAGSTKPDHNFLDAKKKDKGSIPAYIVDGPGAGSIKYVKSYESYSSSVKREAGSPIPLAERKVALNKRRTIRFITKIIQLLNYEQPVQTAKERGTDRVLDAEKLDDTWTFPGKELSNSEIYKLIASFGAASHTSNNLSSNTWKVYNSLKGEEKELSKISLQCACVKIIGELRTLTYMQNPDKKFADQVCKALYLDSERLWNMVLEEIKEPKIWTTLNADGTIKEKTVPKTTKSKSKK